MSNFFRNFRNFALRGILSCLLLLTFSGPSEASGGLLSRFLEHCKAALGGIGKGTNLAFASTEERFVRLVTQFETTQDREWNNPRLNKAYTEAAVRLRNNLTINTHIWKTLYDKKDPRAIYLVEKLGWKIAGRELLPPKTAKEFFFHIYKDVHEKMQRGEIEWSDVVLPAFIFKNKSDDKDIIFVAPGVDPWPDFSKYEIYSFEKDMPHSVWVDTLEAGRMPIDFTHTFAHDVGHIIDLKSPEIMTAMRHYYRAAKHQGRILANMGITDLPIQHMTPVELERARKVASQIMVVAEYTSLPRSLDERERKSMFGFLFENNTPLDLEVVTERLNKMPEAERKSHIEMIIQQGKGLLLFQGGAMNDAYGLEKFGGERNSIVRVLFHTENDLNISPRSIHTNLGIRPDSNVYPIAQETLHSLLYEIEWSYRLLYDLRDTASELKQRTDFGYQNEQSRLRVMEWLGKLEALSAAERSTILEKILIDRVAQFDAAIYAANVLGLTPAQTWKDISEPELSAQSKTARYYRAWTRPDSFLRRTFSP